MWVPDKSGKFSARSAYLTSQRQRFSATLTIPRQVWLHGCRGKILSGISFFGSKPLLTSCLLKLDSTSIFQPFLLNALSVMPLRKLLCISCLIATLQKLFSLSPLGAFARIRCTSLPLPSCSPFYRTWTIEFNMATCYLLPLL